MSWWDKWVLSLLPAGLLIMQGIIKGNINKPEFWEKYGNVLRRIVQIAKIVEPYLPENQTPAE